MDAAFIVVATTRSNGRRWFESRRSGACFTRDLNYARFYLSEDAARRSAQQWQRDIDRGLANQTMTVETYVHR